MKCIFEIVHAKYFLFQPANTHDIGIGLAFYNDGKILKYNHAKLQFKFLKNRNATCERNNPEERDQLYY